MPNNFWLMGPHLDPIQAIIGMVIGLCLFSMGIIWIFYKEEILDYLPSRVAQRERILNKICEEEPGAITIVRLYDHLPPNEPTNAFLFSLLRDIRFMEKQGFIETLHALPSFFIHATDKGREENRKRLAKHS